MSICLYKASTDLVASYDEEYGVNFTEINGKRLNLLEEPFTAMLVNSGHVNKYPNLATHVNQIVVMPNGSKNTEIDDSDTYMFYPELTVIPMGVVAYRYTLFNSEGTKAVCASYTTPAYEQEILPDPNRAEATAYSPVCAKIANIPGKILPVLKGVCHCACWGQNREKPECQSTMDLMFFSPEIGVTFLMTVKSYSMGAYSKFMDEYNRRRQTYILKNKSFANKVCKISSEMVETSRRGVRVQSAKFEIVDAPEEWGSVSAYYPLMSYYAKKYASSLKLAGSTNNVTEVQASVEAKPVVSELEKNATEHGVVDQKGEDFEF